MVLLCDVDQAVLYRQAEQFRASTGRAVRIAVDYRSVVEDPKIDAITIATCNHTHALIAMAALQNRKHVYIEKPCSHNFWEGQQLVRAAEKSACICFHGTQARTSPAVREAMQWLQKGLIGQLWGARIRTVGPALPPPAAADEPPPPGLAYDLWLGPAPYRPFNRSRFHRYWRWWPEYGNGPLGNQALHLVDLARWGLGVGWPVWVWPVGRPPKYNKHTLICSRELWQLDFPEQKTLRIELQPARPDWKRSSNRPFSETVTFYGTEGLMEVDCSGYRSWLGPLRKPGPASHAPCQEFQEFLQAIGSQHLFPGAPDLYEAHLSCGLVHLVNIARHLGRAVRFDPLSQTILADPDAAQLWQPPSYRKPFLLPEIA